MKTQNFTLFAILILGLHTNVFSLCLDVTQFSGIFKRTYAQEVRLHSVDYATYRAKYDALWGQGWRLKELDVRQSGQIYIEYSAVWIKSTVSEIQYYGITEAQFKSITADKWSQGWRIFLIANYLDANNVLRFTVVFRPGNTAEAYRTGYTKTAFVTEYNNLNSQGYRLKAVEMYQRNNITYYTGIFHKSTVSEYGLTEWTFNDFVTKYNQLVGSGWRLSALDKYYRNGKFYYTGFFRYESSADAYVFGYGLYDYKRDIEAQWYAQGYTTQIMTLAGAEYNCEDVNFNPVRIGEEDEEPAAAMIDGSEVDLYMNVSPNPSLDGKFNLMSDQFEEEAGSVEILKTDGSKVLEKNIQLNGFHSDLDLGELSPGIYILNIRIGEMIIPKKVVIQ